MHASTPRIWTPARIVALVVIALVAAGLAFVRFGTGSDPVSIPDGAKAGDLVLEDCEYATEDGSYAADCGTLVVPENRANPDSRLIALRVTRIRAQTGRRSEPLFRLEGGPGKTNLEFPMASRFIADRDVVLVGYRGVDSSTVLDCPEVESAIKHSKNLGSEKFQRSYGDAFHSCADRLEGEGADLAGYTISQRADDIEAARVALGYDRVNLVSESAGSRYAMVYAWRYPKSVNRSVLLAVNPPGHFLWDAKTTNEQIARYAKHCAMDEKCSSRTDDLAATLRETDVPKRWGFLPIKEAGTRIATFYGLMESTQEAGPLSAPAVIDTWLSAEDGDPSGFWFQSLLADVAFPKAFVWGELAAMGQADDEAARRYYASGFERHEANDFTWGGGTLIDGWPSVPNAGEYDRVRRSDVETLLIGGELDFSTPPQVATKELVPHLTNGREVVLPGFSHSTTFWTEQREAGTRLIDAFLDSGRVDTSLYEPQKVDFTPEVSYTALAKGFAGTMIALAILSIVSLLAMARRVRRRGGYGRKASAVLRSVYPIVLGFGGYLGGVLVVISTMPGVPIDDPVLAVTSVGVPVGLGIALAWINSSAPRLANAVGVSVAVAGSLVGAWLGFHAAADLVALLTAIAGAIAGGNLALIVFDVARARTAEEAERVEAAPQVAAS